MSTSMLDGYGRKIDYLRISITDKCNLRCRYCMPHDIEAVAMSEILTYEEIVAVVHEAAALGISRIKITGGEPLIRRDVSSLIRMLGAVPGIEQVTLTTNGVTLSESLAGLISAGIDGINISLDTLDEERYRLITGFDRLDDVLRGMRKALEQGIRVKINAVSLAPSIFPGGSATDDGIMQDAEALIMLSKDLPLDVRFIELMPIGMGRDFPGISHDVLIPLIRKRFPGMEEDKERHGNGPAVYYRIPGHKGCVGFISAIHGVFCDSCNRIRLTSQGYLKTCLCYDEGADLKGVLRSYMSDEEKSEALRDRIRKAVLCKPKAHSFRHEERISERHAMSAIGG